MSNPVPISNRYIFHPIDQALINLDDFPNNEAETYFQQPVRLLFRRHVEHKIHLRSPPYVQGDIAILSYEQNSTSNLSAVLNHSVFYYDPDTILKEQISSLLTRLDISSETVHLAFIDKIKDLVRQRKYPVSVSGNIVKLVAEIRIVREFIHYVDYVDEDERILQSVLAESTSRVNHGMVPARKTAIFKALTIERIVKTRHSDEKVVGKRKRDDEELESCPICMDEFPIRAYVTKMPCGHRFHGQCIVKWLKTSHFCPVCRFEISTK